MSLMLNIIVFYKYYKYSPSTTSRQSEPKSGVFVDGHSDTNYTETLRRNDSSSHNGDPTETET